jgi:hypothetical protein
MCLCAHGPLLSFVTKLHQVLCVIPYLFYQQLLSVPPLPNVCPSPLPLRRESLLNSFGGDTNHCRRLLRYTVITKYLFRYQSRRGKHIIIRRCYINTFSFKFQTRSSSVAIRDTITLSRIALPTLTSHKRLTTTIELPIDRARV